MRPGRQVVYPSGSMVSPWVTASRFLAGNRNAELKPTTFSSLLLIRVFLSFFCFLLFFFFPHTRINYLGWGGWFPLVFVFVCARACVCVRGGGVWVQLLGVQGSRARVILVLRECIWNAPAVSLVFPTFDFTGSLYYPPH